MIFGGNNIYKNYIHFKYRIEVHRDYNLRYNTVKLLEERAQSQSTYFGRKLEISFEADTDFAQKM
jgi:hypothetical protein